MTSKISVIIPIYNTEPYLRQCLDSVINQTLSDIEIICINDASPDNSLSTLKEYAAREKRVKIIDFQDNKGVSIARNAGIEAAQGEYIGFVDSDDYPDLDFYEKLYTLAKETGADIAKGNEKLPDNIVRWHWNEKIKENKANFLYNFSSAIYKRELLIENNIIFPPLSYWEDPVFSFNAGVLANKIEIIDDAFINIVKREDSASASTVQFDKMLAMIKGLDMIIDAVNNISISDSSYLCILKRSLAHFKKFLKNTDKHDENEIKEKIFNALEKVKPEYEIYVAKEPIIGKIYLKMKLQKNIRKSFTKGDNKNAINIG